MKKIVLNVADHECSFDVTSELYAEYLGMISQGDMVTAANNFVMQAACDTTKSVLRELDEQNAGALLQISGALIKEFAPKIAISVKK